MDIQNNPYLRVSASCTPLKHGQEVRRLELLNAFLTATRYGETTFICRSANNTSSRYRIRGAIQCLESFREPNLVVSCDSSGFIFQLTKVQKRNNLIKNGRSESEADEMLKDDLDILYPLPR